MDYTKTQKNKDGECNTIEHPSLILNKSLKTNIYFLVNIPLLYRVLFEYIYLTFNVTLYFIVNYFKFKF